MKYIITKDVRSFTYYLQEYKGERFWSGLKDNAKKFDKEWLAGSYKLMYKIKDGEVKPI